MNARRRPLPPQKPIVGRSCLPVGLALALAPTSAIAQDGGLTEDEAVRRALGRPAVAAVVEGEVGVARGDAVDAGRWSNPVVSYSREQVFGGGAEGSDDFVTLSQEIDLGGRRSLRRDAGRQRVLAAEHQGAWARVALAAEARHRFYDVLLATGRLGAAEAWLARVDAAAHVVGRRTAAGDASAYDHRRLLRERATAEAGVREGRAALAATRARLARLVGAEDPAALAVSGALLPDGAAEEAAALADRVARRPDLKALDAEVTAAGMERRAASRGWVPDLGLEAGLKTGRAAAERGWGFVAGVSLPLPFVAVGQGEAARAAGLARLASGRRDLLLSEALGEADGLLAQVDGLSEAARVFRRDAAGPSEELARTAEVAYKSGEVGVLELLDAWRSVLDASVRALELEAAARRADIELRRTLGEVER
ncbi:MAG: TolC family protein [Deltaproteobacteria bacterium]|nr:TolC family protein [Deltaproteobacteria bacterium]